jgi:hypothetical protein
MLLSSCYAQSMHLQEESPWGPEQQGLQIQIAPGTPPHLLKIEHKLLEAHFGPSNTASDWLFTLKLHTKTSKLQFPFIWGREKTSARLRMEIEATGDLVHQGKLLQSYVWKAQGDTIPEKQDVLTTRLLERLNGQIYEQLGPRYVYE